MKPTFLSPWFVWAGILVLISAVVAYGNIHMGPEASRLSPWNWVWVAVMGGLVVGTRCYQYFVQKR